MTKPNTSFLFIPVPCSSQKFASESTKPRLPLHPHPLRAYSWLTSLLLFAQPSQHISMAVPRVLCASLLSARGMVALFGVRHHCIVKTKITWPSILLLFCSHLCLLFITRPFPTFPASLMRAYARLKRCACEKNRNNNQPAGAKGMSPFCFSAVSEFWSSFIP